MKLRRGFQAERGYEGRGFQEKQGTEGEDMGRGDSRGRIWGEMIMRKWDYEGRGFQGKWGTKGEDLGGRRFQGGKEELKGEKDIGREDF